MKLFILYFLLVISTLTKANYLPVSQVKNSAPSVEVETNLKRCEALHKETCLKLPFGYDFKIHGKKEITRNGSEIWGTRSKVEVCISESSCRNISVAKNKAKPDDCSESDSRLECSVQNCTDGRTSYYNTSFSEVWCNKITGYNQVGTGQYEVVEDLEKKTAFLEQSQKAKARKERIERGKRNRLKCQNALDIIAGFNTDGNKTEAEIDAMEVAFSEIHKALNGNRPNKAHRLISLINDPSFSELKSELLDILK